MAEESEALAPMDRMALYAVPEVGDMSNPLLHKRCSQLGRNRFFEARPATVHLAGFEVGRTVSVKLEVLNVAATAQRLRAAVKRRAARVVAPFVRRRIARLS